MSKSKRKKAYPLPAPPVPAPKQPSDPVLLRALAETLRWIADQLARIAGGTPRAR